MSEYITPDSPQDIPYGYCHCGCGQKTRLAPRNRKDRNWHVGEPMPFYGCHRPKAKPIDESSVPPRYCRCGCGEITPICKSTYRPDGHIKGERHEFARGHNLTVAKGKPRYTVNTETGCWVWQRAVNTCGYGVLTNGLAHRLYWEAANGAVPPGYELDHLCRNRACVNPAHLQPVSHMENCRRGVQGKLTPATRTQIIALHKSGEWNEMKIARMFGVSRTSIQRVIDAGV